jgi:RHS repeat-associated protein
MKKGSTVYYMFGDHLGSTAITASSAGAKLGELRYKPWGESRYAWGTTYTNRRFTGQLDETTSIGLYFFNARFYDPLLARFTSADSLIPDPGNPQAWDRYAFTLNNPVKYIDPSGHDVDCSPWDSQCLALVKQEKSDALLNKLIGQTQSGTKKSWDQITEKERQEVLDAGWTEGEYSDFGGNATDVGGTYQDPAVWAVGLISAGKLTPSAISILKQYFRPILVTGTYAVYRVVENGVTRYIGITGDFARRAGEHLRTSGWVIEPIPGLERLSKFDARAVEQVLIEHYELANLYNKINSIAINNPIYPEAYQRGTEILQIIGLIP